MAVVLTLVQTKQIRINIHKRNNTKIHIINKYTTNTSLYIYRVQQEERTRLREGVPYVKLYRKTPKHLYPKLNGLRDNGQ